MNKAMWEHDKYLRNISIIAENYELISFDVFDTVLFRTVSNPEKIFLRTGELMRELYPEYDLPPEVFAGMRAEADGLARKGAWDLHKYEDVTLDEIYAEFHLGEEFQKRAKECELQTESRHIYLNHSMAEFLRYCREQGKLIAMVSDTFFNEREIKTFLESCGFELSLVDFYVISCEFRVMKHNGKLFEKLLNAAPAISPRQVLHIGDNRLVDIGGAAIAGIRAEYYGAIPRAIVHPLEVEQKDYATVEPLLSLRKLACTHLPPEYRTLEEITLFETGAYVFGAIYSAFAEWVLEQSLKAGIGVVLTFMREGELLAQIIDRAALNRGLDITVKPVFISRRTTEVVGLGVVDGSVIDEYSSRDGLTLSDLFSIFYLDVGATPFSPDQNCTIGYYKENGKIGALNDYLKQPAVLAEINEKVSEQRGLLIEYIQSLTGGKDAITVDIGFRGTMQSCLSGIEANGESELLHLLMMGLPYNNRFLLKGTKIRGWLAYGSENEVTTEQLHRRIQMPESVTNADIGTTLSYEKKDGTVRPVLERVRIDEEIKKKKEIIRHGIKRYQELWFTLISEKPHLVKETLGDKEGFIGILSRLLLMPTREEATILGGVNHEECIGTSAKCSIINPADFSFYDISGSAEKFVEDCLSWRFPEHVLWPEGVAAIKNQHYYIDRYTTPISIPASKKVKELFDDARLTGKRVAVYGAGIAGKVVVDVLCKLGIEICFMVDNNPNLQGTSFLGNRIISPEESVGEAEVYIVTPLLFEEEIRQQLIQLTSALSEKPEIITFR